MTTKPHRLWFLPLLLALLIAACGGGDDSDPAAGDLPADLGSDGGGESAGAGGGDPCGLGLATAADLETFIGEQAEFDFTVAPEPRTVIKTCVWDIDFPGIGATYLGVGLITPDEAQQRRDGSAGAEIVDVPGLGGEAVYYYNQAAGDTLEVAVGEQILTVEGGELDTYTNAEQPQDVLAGFARLVLPRVE